MTNNNRITLYTDGSCQTSTGEGGWAAVLQSGEHERVLQGRAENTTSNVMELTAVIKGLSALKQAGTTVQIFTDAKYVAKGVNEWLPGWIAQGWKNSKNKPVANRGLWQQLKALLDQHTVTVTWVPREQNTRADKLAQQARTNAEPASDVDPASVTQEIRVYIAGSRDATGAMLNYAIEKVREAHKRGYTVLVGDNPRGVDRAVVLECRKLKAKVVVAGVGRFPRNGGCEHGSYVKVDRNLYQADGGGRLNGFTVRDRYLADNAQIGLFLWNGRSKGTKDAYDHMASNRADKAHLVTFKRQPVRA